MPITHGTYSGYNHYRCRCQPCLDAGHAYTKRLRWRHEHGIYTGHPRKTTPPRKVPAVGTIRRLQALVATGWSQSAIAARAGVTFQAINYLIRKDVEASIYRSTADQVTALYEQMWRGPGTPKDRWDAGGQRLARKFAEGRGWAPPLAWDDETIDDPAATPSGGLVGGWKDKAGALIDDLTELLEQGVSPIETARRLGYTRVESLARRLERNGRGDLAAPFWAEAARERRAA